MLLAGLAIPVAASGANPSDCWMTGGGSRFGTVVIVEYTGRTTHGFVLHCDTGNPNNLQINWEDNRFHLADLTSAMCPDTAGTEPNPLDAEFDTVIGFGVGKLNGNPGATISFTFTDASEPGKRDGRCGPGQLPDRGLTPYAPRTRLTGLTARRL